MAQTVVILGALDTKGKEYAFVKRLIEQAGLQTLVVDFGVMGAPEFAPEIASAEVAQAGGGDLRQLTSGDRKDEAMQTMARGLALVVRNLYDEGKLDGVFGMGGTGGTSIITTAMRILPVGVPKLMLSTIGGGDVGPYAGTKDIAFMPSIVDVAGLNRISRKIYGNAAGAIVGMTKAVTPAGEEKPLVTASMFGNTTSAVNHARKILEEEGYEVLVFHATGVGGRTMESLIADGYIEASLDLTTTELADYVCGGVFSAGPDRLQAAARAGVPTVIAPGCVDMANFNAISTVPSRYQHRQLYQWNPNVTLLRTNVEENTRIGRLIAAAANGSGGPVAILLPLRGVSMLDSPNGEFWNPKADQACFDAIMQAVNPDITIIEVDANINDPQFSSRAAYTLLDMLK